MVDGTTKDHLTGTFSDKRSHTIPPSLWNNQSTQGGRKRIDSHPHSQTLWLSHCPRVDFFFLAVGKGEDDACWLTN